MEHFQSYSDFQRFSQPPQHVWIGPSHYNIQGQQIQQVPEFNPKIALKKINTYRPKMQSIRKSKKSRVARFITPPPTGLISSTNFEQKFSVPQKIVSFSVEPDWKTINSNLNISEINDIPKNVEWAQKIDQKTIDGDNLLNGLQYVPKWTLDDLHVELKVPGPFDILKRGNMHGIRYDQKSQSVTLI